MNAFPMQRFFMTVISLQKVCLKLTLYSFFLFFFVTAELSLWLFWFLVGSCLLFPHHFSSLCINCSWVQGLSVWDLTITHELPIYLNAGPSLWWINGKAQDGFTRLSSLESCFNNRAFATWTLPLVKCFYQHLSHSRNSRVFSELMGFDAALQTFMKVFLPLLEWPSASPSPPNLAQICCKELYFCDVGFFIHVRNTVFKQDWRLHAAMIESLVQHNSSR